MQSLHPGMRPPQRHTVNHQALAIAVEQIMCAGAAQPFANRPDMGLDDIAAERSVDEGTENCVAGIRETLESMQEPLFGLKIA